MPAKILIHLAHNLQTEHGGSWWHSPDLSTDSNATEAPRVLDNQYLGGVAQILQAVQLIRSAGGEERRENLWR
jgi:hypothetical protein